MADKEYLQRQEEQAREARTVRKIVFFTVLAFAVLIAAFIGGTIFYIKDALQPVNPDSDKKIRVHIPLDSSMSEIANRLDEKGVIKSAKVFHYYAKYKNENGFQAGYYQFSPSMTIDQIIDRMEKGEVTTAFKLIFPEGEWMTGIADIVSKHTKISKEYILKKMKNRQYIKDTYMKKYPFLKDVILDPDIRYPLEGYLFPATYSFYKKDVTLEEILDEMLDKTGAVLKNNNSQIKKSKMSIHEVLTLASMIEEEATNDKSRDKISSVFHNRLKKEMPLQSNPTVDYAAKKHRLQIGGDDLDVESPYNTYLHKGLPVGPISNPGGKSIEAVLHPAKTDALYFYARPTGEILYSKTYADHLKVIGRYKYEWDEYMQRQKNKKE